MILNLLAKDVLIILFFYTACTVILRSKCWCAHIHDFSSRLRHTLSSLLNYLFTYSFYLFISSSFIYLWRSKRKIVAIISYIPWQRFLVYCCVFKDSWTLWKGYWRSIRKSEYREIWASIEEIRKIQANINSYGYTPIILSGLLGNIIIIVYFIKINKNRIERMSTYHFLIILLAITDLVVIIFQAIKSIEFDENAIKIHSKDF